MVLHGQPIVVWWKHSVIKPPNPYCHIFFSPPSEPGCNDCWDKSKGLAVRYERLPFFLESVAGAHLRFPECIVGYQTCKCSPWGNT